MGRRNSCRGHATRPQKKYARQFDHVIENKRRNFIKQGKTGCVPKARPGSGQGKVAVT